MMSGAKKINYVPVYIVVLLFLVSVTLIPGCQTGPQDKSSNSKRTQIKIAAAADVQPVFEELGKVFEGQTGIKPVFIFGSSGQLAQQIIAGARVDMYASADEEYVDKVVAAGAGLKETKRQYAIGRLTVVSGNRTINAPLEISQLKYMKINKIAIANPDHAPYGRAAREALITAGIWRAVKDKLVLGENARQTFQYAETGNADMVLAPLSLVKNAKGMSYYIVPAGMHKPIEQTLVITNGDKKRDVLRFITLLTSKKGIETMKKYGFEQTRGAGGSK